MQNDTLLQLSSQQLSEYSHSSLQLIYSFKGTLTQNSGAQQNTQDLLENLEHSLEGPKFDVHGRVFAPKKYLGSPEKGESSPQQGVDNGRASELANDNTYIDEDEEIDSGNRFSAFPPNAANQALNLSLKKYADLTRESSICLQLRSERNTRRLVHYAPQTALIQMIRSHRQRTIRAKPIPRSNYFYSVRTQIQASLIKVLQQKQYINSVGCLRTS